MLYGLVPEFEMEGGGVVGNGKGAYDVARADFVAYLYRNVCKFAIEGKIVAVFYEHALVVAGDYDHSRDNSVEYAPYIVACRCRDVYSVVERQLHPFEKRMVVLPELFYYNAVGLGSIEQGIFPNVHYHFNYVQDCLPTPGYADGVFYQMVESAKAAGERPTAAFPSSHVGISTIIMLLAWRTGDRRMFFILLPFYVLLCLSTVYIQAHYAIDVLAGWVTGVALYFVLMWVGRKVCR